MAKTLDHFSMFVVGEPSAESPREVRMSYSVINGGYIERDKTHYASPPWNRSVDVIWDETVAAIKTKEGVA